MLLCPNGLQIDQLPAFQRWQQPALVVASIIGILLVDLHIAGINHGGASGTEDVGRIFLDQQLDGHQLQGCRDHLTRDCPFPD